MADVQPEAVLRHKCREPPGAVAPALHTAENRQTGRPRIGDGQRVVHVGGFGVVQPPAATEVRRPQHGGRTAQDRRTAGKRVHDGLLRENVVAGQIAEKVDAEPIHRDDRRVQHLRRRPCGHAQQHDRPAGECRAFCKQPPALDAAHGQQYQGTDPQHMAGPENANTRYRHNQIEYRCGHPGGDIFKGMAERHVEIPLRPAQHQQSQRGRNQQFPRALCKKRLAAVAVQRVPRRRTANQKQHDHEPWVQQILQRVLPATVRHRPHDTHRHDMVVHKNGVVQNHQQYSCPADVVEIVLSHIYHTFAMIFNKYSKSRRK